MRILILLMLFLELSSAIIVFRDKENIKVVSLGEHNSELKLKVYKNKKIVFIDENKLKQVSQYDAEAFITFLNENNLSFQCLLDNKWNIEIDKNNFYLKNKKQKVFRKLALNFYYYIGNSVGFYCAFKTKNHEIYGFINYKYKSVKNRYSMDIKIEKNIFSVPLTIKYHKK